ncbi:MAG: long-chain fatty acid--CoA ligase [Chlamydiae bacterium]|nr:long-chain fatty acid--CoA ligase [Chlamydiota bacterium]MBI3276663.1 long-chain fatty acid--CoA ligase [Chlamydiota bacterium]
MTSSDLDTQILSIINQGVDQPLSDSEFNKIALELFEYQFTHNLPYQKYCKNLDITPSKISHWSKILFVPTSTFKEAVLSTFPSSKAKKVFYTSGTTLKKSGRHYLENLMLYEEALLTNFKSHFKIKSERWPLLVLTPSPLEAPHSSLSHMMGCLQREIGYSKTQTYFIQKGQLLIHLLRKKLKQFISQKEPVLILGTAFSFVHFLDACAQQKWGLKLPIGSRVMETGGFKGKSRELSKENLYKEIQNILGVPLTHIINEYGMTEMGSQFYDNTLKNRIEKKRMPVYKNIPPWVRTRILNPLTLEEEPPGKVGLLQHYDLANRSSVMGILTEDLGVKIKDGFEILGRAPLAEARGCSLNIEQQLILGKNLHS